MLRVFNGTYTGFQSKRCVGEIFDYENTKWIIIHILNTNLTISKNPIIRASLIAQQIGKDAEHARFDKEHTITDRLPIEGRKPWDKNTKKIGGLVKLYGKESQTRVPALITGVESFEYDYTDLVVKYKVGLIEPWSDDQMDKAIQENRLSTFKVLQGKKE